MEEFDFSKYESVGFVIQSSPAIFLIILTVIFGIYFLFARFKKINGNKFINFIFVVYITALISVVFLPIEYRIPEYRNYMFMQGYGRIPSIWEAMSIDFIPFQSVVQSIILSFPDRILRSVIIYGGNLFLLSPIPIFLWFIKNGKISIKRNILIGFSITVFIELTQLLINLITGWPNRVISINDIILNTAGVIITAFLADKLLPVFFPIKQLTK